MRRLIPTIIALAWVGACGGEAPADEQLPQGPTRADSVAIADSVFNAAVFDTIARESTQKAIERGGLVFRISCSKCHGDGGRGNGNFVIAGDTLRPPSFLASDWRFMDDPMGLRRYIFSGNVAGMPYWGLVGLSYRDIDAVARYINEFLRVNYGQK